ncbi:nucleoside hydrolase [Tabrizicola sp.]|uniref:nucleoside hydrolase n=1 Tax=Tabrizicola sp. TaxID=2005166 RepID=UPI00286B6907|nr:nucleoside hydrolase [Tabrizicola sp.]
MPQTPLALIAGGPQITRSDRIWIDSDAACGATARTDPDDCLAILWLAARGVNIVGISSSFGNASGAVVAERMAALASKMAQDDLPVPAIFPGHAEPAEPKHMIPPGVVALQSALDAGPLTILALGPLTNLAAALKDRPDLRGNVTRIVAVMGHQPGQLFHPTEGHGTGAAFGHGPIFRDLNVSVDPDAVRSVLAMNLPMTLIAYDAALGTLVTGADLDLLARRGRSFAWAAGTARDWLAFWKSDVGLPGFAPFDWMAAAYLERPQLFDCAAVNASMTREWAFWLLPRPSLVVQLPPLAEGTAASRVLYCPKASPAVHDLLISH